MLLGGAFLGQAIQINGTWNQRFSSMYVQSTTEGDWRCIKVNVTVDDQNRVSWYKTAHLHGGPLTVTTDTRYAQLHGDKVTVKTHVDALRLKDTKVMMKTTSVYDVHSYSNQTLVITGEDDPALYVWTKEGYDEGIDVPRLHAYLQELGFIVKDDEYNFIVETYDNSKC